MAFSYLMRMQLICMIVFLFFSSFARMLEPRKEFKLFQSKSSPMSRAMPSIMQELSEAEVHLFGSAVVLPDACLNFSNFASDAIWAMKDMCLNYISLKRNMLQLLQTVRFDFLALQSSWTDLDTELLQRESDVPKWIRDLSTAELKNRLPSVTSLSWLFPEKVQHQRTLALIGSSGDLNGSCKGGDIDAYDHVVRCNNFVLSQDHGHRITEHVINHKDIVIENALNDSVPIYDLEVNEYWRVASWEELNKTRKTIPELTQQMWGLRLGAAGIGPPVFFLRPTLIHLFQLKSFTRGFLWLIICGQYARKPTLYGFKDYSTFNGHPLYERMIYLEHVVYRALHNAGMIQMM